MSDANSKVRPILSMAICPRSANDGAHLQRALREMEQKDSTVRVDAESIDGQTVVSGMSETHLESICNRLINQYGIEIDFTDPKVIYLETIRKAAEADGKYIRQTGGSGNYGHCKLRIEPNIRGAGYEFINAVEPRVVPEKYIMPIERGVLGAMKLGILAGHAMVDVKVTLFDGSYHEADSNEMAFQFAGSIAFKEASRKASPVLLEPIMAVEATVPEQLVGAIIADINSRRGRIEAMEHVGDSQFIKAMIPLAKLLSTSPHGRPDYSIEFAVYDIVPRDNWFGGNEPGVTANRPKTPHRGRSSASASPEPEFE